jgi:structural maintenance of chromosome 4
MKPKAPSEHEDGLLEYLEDIIGTSKYKEPIEEALLEMDRLQEDRSEKMNRLRIVEREKNALQDKKKEAEDYLRLQNEHVRALSRLWQWYLWKCLINEEEFQKKMVGFLYHVLFAFLTQSLARTVLKRSWLRKPNVIRMTLRTWRCLSSIIKNVGKRTRSVFLSRSSHTRAEIFSRY